MHCSIANVSGCLRRGMSGMFCNSAYRPLRRYTGTATLHHTPPLTLISLSLPLHYTFYLPNASAWRHRSGLSVCVQSCNSCMHTCNLACVLATLQAHVLSCMRTCNFACVYAVVQLLHAYMQPCMYTCNLASTLALLHVHE